MRRRTFLGVLGGAAAWPLAGRAQQPDRVRVIGALFDLMDNTPVAQSYIAAFRDELAKLGWKEGSNLRIESRFNAGDMSEGDYLKIRLQLLQFQSDVSGARLARIQALSDLRQFLGFESVPDDYDVTGDLDYQPVFATVTDLKALASHSRPDLIAAQQSVTAARSQEALARANGKQDLTAGANYTHTAGISSIAVLFNIPLAVFDKNQGEIARTGYAITQAQELASETAQQVSTDVVEAYENLHTNDQIIQLYRGGYVDQAKKSRDISEYAYHRGAASLLDYLDSERTYRSNQLAYRQALANYMLALEQLRQAVGTRNLP
jgi:cobalt-zinc-cadmium efflux system outer membrane protein